MVIGMRLLTSDINVAPAYTLDTVEAIVTHAEVERLVPAVKAVLEQAIAAGGSTLRDHAQVDGELGYFQKEWRVYGREGGDCAVCASPVERRVQSGRSSFFCATCQR